MSDQNDDVFFLDDEFACRPGNLQGANGGSLDSLLPDIEFPPDPELAGQGWERRFMADGNRSEEAVQLYRELGYEIHMEPVRPEELSEYCGDCALVACRAYVTIYTRKPAH